ncbi:ceramide-1-phosphate transfer protein-like [Exaiptasia diaphana]|uniref:Glycolipid transfer protein domain-containing protein n=1 Tax=Exaiptasia diaphana TaxID=2652724 RepID=A0A913XIN4_EXADI|nr:ceramide-1-phosphate transfer protein [Exaiptasia diaphana]XP_020905402.1 ceramide-1-phosphate transfer protein-like [Exaiptasia diaphana]
MTERKFRLDVVVDSFTKAKQEDGSIVLDEYVRGYDELCIFFDSLGSVFGFITSDVRDKIGILKHHRSNENGKNYDMVKRMFDFEVEKNLTAAQTKPLSGSRTLLRLHRALAFTVLFMKGLSEASDKDDSSKLAADAYNETLARYHPWLIRKAALLAMYTLDNVGDMIKKASGGNANEEEAKKLLKEGVDAIQPVYDATEALYTSYDLHGLP